MRINSGDADLVAEFFNSEDVIIYYTETDVWVDGVKLTQQQYTDVLNYKKDYCKRLSSC